MLRVTSAVHSIFKYIIIIIIIKETHIAAVYKGLTDWSSNILIATPASMSTTTSFCQDGGMYLLASLYLIGFEDGSTTSVAESAESVELVAMA